LGLGVQYSVNAKTPTIWLFLFEVNVGVDAGLAFGVVVAVRYNPNFALLRAGIWADLWADIVVNYKSTLPFSKWKSFSLLKIYAQGDLLLTFEPKPSTLEGKLKGYVRLLGLFSVDFDAGFKKEI
ncbi:MAG: hypothetical protein K2U26_12635, partial [Cyclobacteriaceae bacterium]|nr:hypothetical protein [Cyclobacteriaceae bacterium]